MALLRLGYRVGSIDLDGRQGTLSRYLANRRTLARTVGGDSHLGRLGHAQADMLITPINDILLDVDILAHIDPGRREARAPSASCEMIWKLNEQRRARGRDAIDWIVMRNRLTHIDAHNKRAVADLLEQLAKRIGFRLAAGLGERVVFHE